MACPIPSWAQMSAFGRQSGHEAAAADLAGNQTFGF